MNLFGAKPAHDPAVVGGRGPYSSKNAISLSL